jgi:hypothetical protein
MREDDKKRADAVALVIDQITATRAQMALLAPSRNVACVLTKLDEAEMWALREVGEVMKASHERETR